MKKTSIFFTILAISFLLLSGCATPENPKGSEPNLPPTLAKVNAPLGGPNNNFDKFYGQSWVVRNDYFDHFSDTSWYQLDFLSNGLIKVNLMEPNGGVTNVTTKGYLYYKVDANYFYFEGEGFPFEQYSYRRVTPQDCDSNYQNQYIISLVSESESETKSKTKYFRFPNQYY